MLTLRVLSFEGRSASGDGLRARSLRDWRRALLGEGVQFGAAHDTQLIHAVAFRGVLEGGFVGTGVQHPRPVNPGYEIGYFLAFLSFKCTHTLRAVWTHKFRSHRCTIRLNVFKTDILLKSIRTAQFTST